MAQGLTPDDLTHAIQAGVMTHIQAYHVYAQLFGRLPDAPQLQLPCEHCGQLAPLSHVVSYKIWTPHPGHPAVAGYDEHDQHYACSQDCAEALVLRCLREHLRPEAERRCAAVPGAAPGGSDG